MNWVSSESSVGLAKEEATKEAEGVGAEAGQEGKAETVKLVDTVEETGADVTGDSSQAEVLEKTVGVVEVQMMALVEVEAVAGGTILFLYIKNQD